MRLILIDDDCLVAGALKMILEAHPDIEVAATADDGREALDLYRRCMPDVLLMDIRMKDVDGLEAASQILAEYPDARILLLTTFQDDEYIIKALKIGARGYLLKQDYQNIVPALHAVCSGQTVFGGSIVSRIPELLGKKAPFDYEAYGLSARESDVLSLIAEGLSNREIASRLYLSEGTVRNYLTAILDKLGLRDRTQAAIFYLEHK